MEGALRFWVYVLLSTVLVLEISALVSEVQVRVDPARADLVRVDLGFAV